MGTTNRRPAVRTVGLAVAAAALAVSGLMLTGKGTSGHYYIHPVYQRRGGHR